MSAVVKFVAGSSSVARTSVPSPAIVKATAKMPAVDLASSLVVSPRRLVATLMRPFATLPLLARKKRLALIRSSLLVSARLRSRR